MSRNESRRPTDWHTPRKKKDPLEANRSNCERQGLRVERLSRSARIPQLWVAHNYFFPPSNQGLKIASIIVHVQRSIGLAKPPLKYFEVTCHLQLIRRLASSIL